MERFNASDLDENDRESYGVLHSMGPSDPGLVGPVKFIGLSTVPCARGKLIGIK